MKRGDFIEGVHVAYIHDAEDENYYPTFKQKKKVEDKEEGNSTISELFNRIRNRKKEAF